jgi:hypothetical protein
VTRRQRKNLRDTNADALIKEGSSAVDRRLFVAGGALAAFGAVRLVGAIDETAAPLVAAPSVPLTPVSTPEPYPVGLPVDPTAAVRYLSPYQFGMVDGAADNTAALQILFDTMVLNPGARAVLPAGVINVTNLRIDYSGVEAQATSGTPYGYAGPKIEGSSKRGTIIRQIEGSTGDLLVVQGKTGAAAGPANNNKISGMSLSNLQLEGASTGGNGLYLRSIVDSSFDELTISNAGGSGLYLARETFISGQVDEYFYGNRFSHLKFLANANWGVECSGTNAIASSFYDCEAIGNASGGYRLAPSGMIMVHCLAIGNGVGSASARGVLSVSNSNSMSTNNGLTMIGCRFEGNSGEGGYEVEIRSGSGHVITGAQFFSTSGATMLGIGLDTNDDRTVRGLVVTGGFFAGDGSTGSQRVAVLGARASSTSFDNLGVDPNQFAASGSALIEDGSRDLWVADPSLFRVSSEGAVVMSPLAASILAPVAPAGASLGVVTGTNGKQSLVVRFPTGSAQVIASEE